MKTWLAIALLATLSAIGCDSNPTPAPKAITPAGRQWSDTVTDDDTFRDFIKTWHMQMNPGVSLQVTSKYEPWLESNCDEFCSFTFTMQQGDNPHKWVDFNCDDVAEKIVQTDLVPLAEQDCKLLRDEAKQYWKDHPDPDNFTDSKGRVWRRQ